MGTRLWLRRFATVAAATAAALLSSGCAVWRSGGLFDNSQAVGGPCRRIATPAGGPEDIAVDPRGGFFVSASDWRNRAGRKTPARGAIYRLDFNVRGELQRTDVTPVAPADFQPHGIDLWAGPDGEARLFVINHPLAAPSRVEIYRLGEGGRLEQTGEGGAWDELHRPNDIAATGPASFFATNDHDVPRIGWFRPSPWERIEDITGWRGGSVVRVRDGKAKVVARGFALANGIALSPDRRLYVAESALGYVQILEDLEAGDLRRVGELDVGPGPDNLTFDAEGALWIGAHNNGLALLRHAGSDRIPSPGRVARIALPQKTPTIVYQSGMAELRREPPVGLSSVSVGAPDGRGGVIVGNIFTPAVEHCPAAARPQQTAARR